MRTIELLAVTRDRLGNNPCRALRREGFVPAVLYGQGKEALSLSVGLKDFETLLKKAGAEHVIVNLKITGGVSIERPAIIKELQKHPLSRAFIHADFQEIELGKAIHMKVPVSLTGKCKGVELGGMVNLIRRELTVVCLPADVPASVSIDITDLDVGEALHLHDIRLPEGIRFADSSVNFTVVTVVPPESAAPVKTEEAAAEAAPAAAAKPGKEKAGK